MTAPRFVVDTMLGRLARWLRAMGYDTLFPRPAEDRWLLELAATEDRVLVTRDGALAGLAGPRGCLIRSEQIDRQLAEVVDTLRLSPVPAARLSRCLECNTPVEPRDKHTLRDVVPARVYATRTEFTGCPACGKVYWLGSHTDRIEARLARVLEPPPGPGADEFREPR